jgi:hypothetical protein
MKSLTRSRILPDGRVEIFTPLKNADGYFVLADRAVDRQHNKAINQFYLKDVDAVIARLRKGGVSLRMRGNLTGQPNLISAREIEISEDEPYDDPFATFTEWADTSDAAAYREL